MATSLRRRRSTERTHAAAALTTAPAELDRRVRILTASVVVVVAVGVALRFLTSSHLWLDEALTVNIARLPLSRIPDALRHDGSPPLYYLLLHGWIAVFGVEPEAGDDTRRSLRASGRVRLPAVPRTIADGLQVQSPGELTFEVTRRLVEDVVAVTDDEIVQAMVFLFERMKVVAEPSGAVGLAALLTGKVDGRGRRTGLILSGGNISADRFARLVAARPD